MKIAVFIHCFFPEHTYGTEVYTLSLVRNLRDRGHEPVVVTAKFYGEKPSGALLTRTEFEGIPVFLIDKNHFPNRRIRDAHYHEEMRAVLRSVLEEVRPDLVHVTHLLNHTAVLLELLAEMNLPAVATFTDFFGVCYNSKLLAADGSLCQGPGPRAVNCIACYLKDRNRLDIAGWRMRLNGTYPLSHVIASGFDRAQSLGWLNEDYAGMVLDFRERQELLRRLHGVYRAAIAPSLCIKERYASLGFSAPIHHIPYGVDLPDIPKPARRDGAPVKFGFFGQIAEHKGTHILIEAFLRLPEGSAELHLFGSAELNRYRKTVRNLASRGRIIFHGTVERGRMPQTYSEMDFVVIPSIWYENCPFVLIESLAMRTPVIASDVAGISEFVRHGENGFLFPRNDVNGLYKILRSILDAPHRFSEMSARCEYPRSSSQMADEVIEVYRSVLGARSVSEKIPVVP